MIIPVWQKLGYSSHRLSEKIGQQLHEPATHTGTLDPLAEGVLVVLTGQDRFQKSQYSQWKKSYEFSFLCGIATDSFDQLGLIQNISEASSPASIEQIKLQLPHFIGKQDQVQPTASASRSGGKSGFDFLKTGQTLNKTNQIEIFSLSYLSHQFFSTEQILSVQADNCLQVTGDFRQKEIIENWKNRLKSEDRQWLVVTLQAITSKRTYIRSLVHDLGLKIGIPTTTWSITRTKNGPYSAADCVQLLQ